MQNGWHRAPLKLVAPAKTASVQFKPEEPVWQLTLDQIEAETGNIVGKKIAPAREAGSSTHCFDTGNVLYSKLRPYLNKVIHPHEKGIATTELVPLRPKLGMLDADFLTYYLRSAPFVQFASQFVAGAKMPRVMMKKFWEHEIPLPSPSEQRRIVEILDQADALRKKRAEADKIADRILPALFYRMFGDPATNPRGWDVVDLGEMTTRITKGESPKWQGFSYVDDGPLFITSENVRWGSLDMSSEKRIPAEFHEKLNRSKILGGDILVNLVGASIGRCCVVPRNLGEANVNQAVAVISPKQPELSRYICSYILQPYTQQVIHGGKVEGGRPNISLTDLRQLPIPMPSPSLLQQYETESIILEDLAQARISSFKKIEGLFATLLHRAFSGDLTAKWREAHMKELLQEMELQAKELNNTMKG